MGGDRHRTSTVVTGLLVLGAVSLVATLPTGCRDEQDPNYWLGKMDDVVWRDQALSNIERLYSKTVREADNDPEAPEVREFVDTVGPKLVSIYESMGTGPTEDIMNKNKVVSLLAQMESPDALPVYISALDDISGQRINRANTAAQAIGRLCISDAPQAQFIPPPSTQTDQWRARCSKAVQGVEVMLSTIDAINEQRAERGSNAENTPEEDALTQSLVSALGNTLLGNPEIPQRNDIIDKLISVVETPDTQQDLRINSQAIWFLGKIGDNRAIPLFARALFIKGRRRPVALQDIVRPALMQVEDLEAMAHELVEVGRMQNKAVLQMQEEAPSTEFDIRIIKEQVAITLGRIGVTSKTVVDYLTEELNHTEVDEVDNTPGRGRTFTPTDSAAFRRAWAGQALSKLHHDPTLPVLMERMEVSKRGDSVDYEWDGLQEVEIPGYLDALGDYLEPSKTNDLLLPFALYADQARLDRAARRLGLQAGPAYAAKLQKRAEEFEECDEQMRQRGCLRENYLNRYIPAIKAAEGCDSIECWSGRLGDDNAFIRERAAHELARLAYGDEAKSNTARAALLKQINEERSQEIMSSLIFAVDRVSPSGCGDACITALQSRIDEIRTRGSQKAVRRALIGLQGRLTYRASSSN